MKVIINDEEYNLEGQITVTKLLDRLDLDPKKIAIERNLEIVPCSEFDSTNLNDNDKLEIIHFIGGG